MLKKVCFAILVFGVVFSAVSLECDSFPKIEEAVPKDFNHFHYATFGVVGLAPSAGIGVRTQRGRWGNDFSLSGASFLIINGLSAQYSRLFYFSKDSNHTGYCGLGPALNYVSISRIFSSGYDHAFFPSAVVSVGGQFKTKNRIHFVELKGNGLYADGLGIIPSLSYGVSF